MLTRPFTCCHRTNLLKHGSLMHFMPLLPAVGSASSLVSFCSRQSMKLYALSKSCTARPDALSMIHYDLCEKGREKH